MGIARSTFYYRTREPSMLHEIEEADLRDRIEQVVVAK